MNTTKETQEMYLKVIYKLSRRKGSVRSADVAAERGYARSTVSYAMKSLRAKGLVTVTADGEIRLTEKGRERVEKVNRRYAVFTEMLERLGVPQERACAVACKMEHIVPDDVFLLIERKFAEEETHSIPDLNKTSNKAKAEQEAERRSPAQSFSGSLNSVETAHLS